MYSLATISPSTELLNFPFRMGSYGDALGFATPAHFSAAFKHVAGQSPRDYQGSAGQ